MAKFQKKINLWADGVQSKIASGELKLQAGQWCVCGDFNETPCRYISHNGRTLNVVHWQGSAARTTAAFNDRIDALRMEKLYQIDPAAWKAEIQKRRDAYRGL